jgi:CubicO group peptidase (beta-lactamase class C family)
VVPIHQVENNLIPATAADDTAAQPASLAARLALYRAPGVSIAVFDNYRLAWARGYGRRENDREASVETDTLFQAASISKTITAVMVIRLVQAGRLELDEDVNRYLTSWPVARLSGNGGG